MIIWCSKYRGIGSESRLCSDKEFTHLSKFIHLDQRSDTDLGAFHGKNLTKNSEPALDQLGRLIPDGWLWTANAFYDNRPGKWASHTVTEVLDYEQFKIQVEKASEENSLNQEATAMSPQNMVQARDSENCFRIVELGIANESDVVILGRPYNENSQKSSSLNEFNSRQGPPSYVFDNSKSSVIKIGMPSTHDDNATVSSEQ